jgi:hypothetical protein
VKKKFLIFTLFIFLLVSAAAKGSDWKFMGKTSEDRWNTYYFIDMESITRPSKSFVRYWELIRSVKRGFPKPTVDELKEGFGYRDYIELNCIDKKKRTVKKEYKDMPKDWEYIEPNSPAEKIYEFLCADKNKQKKLTSLFQSMMEK